MNTLAACSLPSLPPTPSPTKLAVREHFPVFQHAADDVFLDNASTTQKPQCVIDAFDTFYRLDCSNAGRAMYSASFKAAETVEQARRDAARFVNAHPYEIALTSGATDSLNTIAWSWGLANLNHGDEILYCPEDHSSAVLPWHNLKSILARTGTEISLIPFRIHAVGDYDFESIKRGLSDRTRVILMSHVHHVFGVDMEVAEIRKLIGSNVILSLDASQSAGHIKVDVRELQADFVSFSGHKMFAGNGVGVLFAKTEIHDQIMSFRCGGQSVQLQGNRQERSRFIDKIECGTPNIPAMSSLSAAINFVESIGLSNIESHVSFLTAELIKHLSTLPGIVFAPGPVTCGNPGGFGILSFRFKQAESMDIASALAYDRIYVRSGMHCRASTGNALPEDFIRVSMHVYNTLEDIVILTESLRSILAEQ